MILVWFEVAKKYIWSNGDNLFEVIGNICNVTVRHRYNFKANKRFEAVTPYWDERAVQKKYIDDACTLAIHLHNGTSYFLDSSLSFYSDEFARLSKLLNASYSTKEEVYRLKQVFAVGIGIQFSCPPRFSQSIKIWVTVAKSASIPAVKKMVLYLHPLAFLQTILARLLVTKMCISYPSPRRFGIAPPSPWEVVILSAPAVFPSRQKNENYG